MSESATDKRIRELARQLENEKRDHARTRNELQAEVGRLWRMVPGYRIDLMGAYPPLRRLFHVLAEAADLQDPSRGAPFEDVMRVEYTPDGETLTPTERGVLTHKRHRADVTEMNKRLRQLTTDLANLISASEYEYHPPEGECECGCGKLIFQNAEGRRRRFYSDACRQRASRKVEA